MIHNPIIYTMWIRWNKLLSKVLERGVQTRLKVRFTLKSSGRPEQRNLFETRNGLSRLIMTGIALFLCLFECYRVSKYRRKRVECKRREPNGFQNWGWPYTLLLSTKGQSFPMIWVCFKGKWPSINSITLAISIVIGQLNETQDCYQVAIQLH